MERINVLTKHLLSKKVQNVQQHFTKPNKSFQKVQEDEEAPLIRISEKVLNALKKGAPVVALESTIISHGMPYPQNVETAKLVEAQVEKYGATPATIAIFKGVIHIGLTNEDLDKLGKIGTKAKKVSRRDVALCVSQKLDGATTVSGTMVIANKVGIKVFVTGGIGGVHREINETLDISADLTELGRTPICVVSAGVKSILDIPKTLEYLETNGVSVIALGSNEFPAFFTRTSGCKAPIRLDTPKDIAKLIKSNHDLNLQSGMMVGVPIPEDQEGKASEINKAIQQALRESNEQHVQGKDITPFLLKRINELTKGESLRSNIALILNNAKMGAQIAVSLNEITKLSFNNFPVLIGGAAIDVSASPSVSLARKSSTPGKVKMTFGGVARNVMEVLSKLNTNPFLISAVGNDAFGNSIIENLKLNGLSTKGLKRVKSQTGVFDCILNEKGDLEYAIADMNIFEDEIDSSFIQSFSEIISKSSLVFVDGNLSLKSLKKVKEICSLFKLPIFVDPTSIPKSLKFVESNMLSSITFLKPNEDEILEMASLILRKKTNDVQLCIKTLLNAGVKNILLTRGKNGVIFANAQGMKSFKAPNVKIINTTGAGDNFVGGFCYGLLNNYTIEECIQLGQNSSKLALSTEFSVHPKLNEEMIKI
eukprot:gene1356-11438_t